MTEMQTAAQPELSEEDATGKLKNLYDEVKTTLRVPSVPRLFRMLASVCPDYVQVAWSSLKPNARTVYFQERVTEIRTFADSRTLPEQARRNASTEISGAITTLHQINPALFLSLAALRSAMHGQQPKLQELTARDKQQAVTPMPHDLQALVHPAADNADTKARGFASEPTSPLYDLIRLTDLASIAGLPDISTGTWSGLQDYLLSAECRQAELGLKRLAEAAASSLPFRMEAQPHTLRHSGLSELQIDSVRGMLNAQYRALPAAVLCSAYLSLSGNSA